MKSLLLCVAVSMMFSGGQCYSESMSCSTVNGKTICNSEKGAGNVAGASSQAISGDGGSYQDAYAMRGDSGTGRGSSSYSQRGYPPNNGYRSNQFFGPAFGPQDSSSSSSYSSSSSSSSGPSRGSGYNGAFAGAGAGSGAFVGNMPPNYGFDPFAFAGVPNPFFGFAFAGRR